MSFFRYHLACTRFVHAQPTMSPPQRGSQRYGSWVGFHQGEVQIFRVNCVFIENQLYACGTIDFPVFIFFHFSDMAVIHSAEGVDSYVISGKTGAIDGEGRVLFYEHRLAKPTSYNYESGCIPNGVAYLGLPYDFVFVTDTKCSVRKFSSKGCLLSTHNHAFKGTGCPTTDKNGSVYISSPLEHCINVYDHKMIKLKVIDTRATEFKFSSQYLYQQDVSLSQMKSAENPTSPISSKHNLILIPPDYKVKSDEETINDGNEDDIHQNSEDDFNSNGFNPLHLPSQTTRASSEQKVLRTSLNNKSNIRLCDVSPQYITINQHGSVIVTDKEEKAVFSYDNDMNVTFCYRQSRTIDSNNVVSNEMKLEGNTDSKHVICDDPVYCQDNTEVNEQVLLSSNLVDDYFDEDEDVLSDPNSLRCPSAVCCDSFDNILIADFMNDKIHLVSPGGQFLGFLLLREDGVSCPNFLTLDSDGQLIVGQYGGDVVVYRYLSYAKHV